MKNSLDVDILLYQLLLHQDLFLVLHLAVLRDGGVAVELQLVVTVLRLAWLVVGQGHLAELAQGCRAWCQARGVVWKSPPGSRPARTPCRREGSWSRQRRQKVNCEDFPRCPM